jgi:hypothetical protein
MKIEVFADKNPLPKRARRRSQLPRWPDALSNSLEPGWVPAKMGGAQASGGLDERLPHASLVGS